MALAVVYAVLLVVFASVAALPLACKVACKLLGLSDDCFCTIAAISGVLAARPISFAILAALRGLDLEGGAP